MNPIQKLIHGGAAALALFLFVDMLNMEPTGAPQQAVQGIYMALAFVGPYTVACLLSACFASSSSSPQRDA